MERHDPLSTAASVEELPAPAQTKKSRKLPPLLRELADVKDATLAFLYGGPEQQPGDYERNLERVATIREQFVQFCTANPYFSNWRQAWAAFIASRPAQTNPEPHPRSVVSLKAPALPRWKARFIQAARA
jgi:hypothetical protein